MIRPPESSNEHQKTILVVDSGVGGLSICQDLLALDLSFKLVYVADDAWFPYGLLDETKLTERLVAIVDAMLPLHQPDLVVLACNTVSTLVLPLLRERYHVPFVGVVPAIKPAAACSRTRCIGLLATPATVRRPYTDQLIADFASDCVVVRIGSNDLVIEAERLFRGETVSRDVIFEVLKPFMVAHQGKQVDTVVLGCTHFPLLKSHLAAVLPNIHWVDSGSAIARRVLSLMPPRDSDQSASADMSHVVYFTGEVPESELFLTQLNSLGLHEVTLKALVFQAPVS